MDRYTQNVSTMPANTRIVMPSTSISLIMDFTSGIRSSTFEIMKALPSSPSGNVKSICLIRCWLSPSR